MRTIVFSTSQTANSTLDILRGNGTYSRVNVVGILDDDSGKQGQQYYGLPVIGGFRDIERLAQSGEATHFILGLGAIKHMLIKSAVFHFCCKLGLRPVNIVSSHACVSKSARLGEGHTIFPMAHISTDCTIGSNCGIHPGAVVMEKCTFQDNVSAAGNVFVGGYCTIKKNVYLGPGAVIGSEVAIGENSVVGAGSVVLKNVPPNSFIRGDQPRCLPMRIHAFYLAPPSWMQG